MRQCFDGLQSKANALAPAPVDPSKDVHAAMSAIRPSSLDHQRANHRLALTTEIAPALTAGPDYQSTSPRNLLPAYLGIAFALPVSEMARLSTGGQVKGARTTHQSLVT